MRTLSGLHDSTLRGVTLSDEGSLELSFRTYDGKAKMVRIAKAHNPLLCSFGVTLPLIVSKVLVLDRDERYDVVDEPGVKEAESVASEYGQQIGIVILSSYGGMVTVFCRDWNGFTDVHVVEEGADETPTGTGL